MGEGRRESDALMARESEGEETVEFVFSSLISPSTSSSLCPCSLSLSLFPLSLGTAWERGKSGRKIRRFSECECVRREAEQNRSAPVVAERQPHKQRESKRKTGME